MTPQERQLVKELFDRLATLENAPRDNGAVDAINEGIDRAPNALYPLVQTVLVQDEALKRADARIRELEHELGIEQPQSAQGGGGFLDNMRDALFSKPEPRGSVPSVRSGGANVWGPAYNQGAPMAPQADQPQYGQPQYGQQYGQQPSPGGSFLGTVAATVAGVVGGAMLMNSFKNMFGGQHGQQQGVFDQPSGGGAPWGGSGGGNNELGRQAGLDDIGRGEQNSGYDGPAAQRAGLFDSGQDNEEADFAGDDSDFGGDSGGDD